MMKSISTWKQELTEGAHAARLAALYCCTPDETPAQAARYAAVLDGLETTFGAHTEAGLYSARPHRDWRQPHRPPARPCAGRQREY